MSMSRCGNICPNVHTKKEGVCFSNRSSVEAAVSGRRCVFRCESKCALFGLPRVDAIKYHWLRFVYDRTAQPKSSILCNTFYVRQFHEPRRVQGWLCTKAISKKKNV